MILLVLFRYITFLLEYLYHYCERVQPLVNVEKVSSYVFLEIMPAVFHGQKTSFSLIPIVTLNIEGSVSKSLRFYGTSLDVENFLKG